MSEITITKDATNHELDPPARNIAEKMQIARNVLKHCERMQNAKNYQYTNNVVKNTDYTGVSEGTVTRAMESYKSAKTFTVWCKEKRTIETTTYCLLIGNIRDILLKLYKENGQVATKERLLNALLYIRSFGMCYQQSRLKHDLLHHGYTWKRLPGNRKSLLVERSDQSLRKIGYLRKIMSYREAGRSIIYVDAYFYYYQLVVSGKYGLLHLGFNGVKQDYNSTLKLWVVDTLTKILPPNSVVVTKEVPQYVEETPTPFSSKADMITWLNEHNIPHTPNLHKADLYAIIKKLYKKLQSDPIYGVLKNYGHEVVYCPNELRSLDYMETMWPGLPAHRCRRDTVDKIKQNKLEDWINCDIALTNKEKSVYQEEVMLEIVVDKLLTLAKYGGLTDADLDSFDDELCEEDYYASIILD